MSLTASQLTAFKADILANQAANAAAGDHGAIVAHYNAATATQIWRPIVAVSELTGAIDWSAFAALSVAKQNTYFALTQGASVDATQATVRAGFTVIFSNGTATTNSLSTLAQRAATVFEALFTTNNVCNVFGYTVTVADVVAALNS